MSASAGRFISSSLLVHVDNSSLSCIAHCLQTPDLLTLSWCHTQLRSRVVNILIGLILFRPLTLSYLPPALWKYVRSYNYEVAEKQLIKTADAPPIPPYAPAGVQWVRGMFMWVMNFPFPPIFPPNIVNCRLDEFSANLKPYFPSSVRNLTMNHLPTPLDAKALPEALESLKIAGIGNLGLHVSLGFDLEPGVLPSSLKMLYMDSLRAEIYPDCFPHSLTELYLWNNESYPEVLPSNLLRFGATKFHDKLIPGMLPSALVSLELNNLSHPISPSLLPSTLTILSMFAYKHPLEDMLPCSLEELHLLQFNQPLTKRCLPSSLTNLHLNCYNKPLDVGVLPSALEILDFGCFNHPLHAEILPQGLQRLTMFTFNHPIRQSSLPSSLKILKLENFDQPLDVGVLPSNLIVLELEQFNHPILAGYLPAKLSRLIIPKFDQPFACFNQQLTELKVKRLQDGIELPASLVELTVANKSDEISKLDSRVRVTVSKGYNTQNFNVHMFEVH